MRKYSSMLIAMLLLLSSHVSAQLTSTGYYRMRNAVTNRYATVVDSKTAGLNYNNPTASDLGALELRNTFDDVVTDPGSVIYCKRNSSTSWDLAAQGVDTYSLVGYHINPGEELSGENLDVYTYYPNVVATVKKAGLTVTARGYLSDHNGVLTAITTTDKQDEYPISWKITPVSNADECYFAVKPEVSYGGKHYTTLYTAFAYRLSAGMTAYYVTGIDSEGRLTLLNIGNTVPANQAVLLECSSADVAANKLLPVTTSPTVSGTNLLKGVFFNINKSKHVNRTAFNSSTMRVLKVENNALLMGQSTDAYLAANRAYLDMTKVKGAQNPVILGDVSAGISTVQLNATVANQAIYDLQGRRVQNPAPGIYIQNGKKVVLK